MPNTRPTALGRRAILAAPLVAALPAPALATGAWPSQTIRIIAPFPAGAVSDAVTRAIAQAIQGPLGTQVVVENRPGVGGGLGAQQAIAARPDGHTLLIVNNATLSMVPRVSQIRFDPRSDLSPVAFLGDAYNLLTINRDLEATTFQEFVDLARRRAGHYVYASPGVGSYGHIAGALLQLRFGIELLHAPFAGIVPAINAVLAGQGHAVMGPNTLPFAQNRQVRGVLAVSATRWPAIPDVPALPEVGVADWPLSFWYAIVAPAGVPLEIRTRLNGAISSALHEPQIGTLFERLGLRREARPVDALGELIASDWQAVGAALDATGVVG
jgi:tripartite-type tricarboxylate transporter receptor subunit TctC